MDSVRDEHRRPEQRVLDLSRDEPRPPAPTAEPGEDGAEDRAVCEVEREPGRPPAPAATGHDRPEQPHVAEGGPGEGPREPLVRGPGAAGDRPGERAAPQ